MKSLEIDELNRLYTKAEEVDKDLFAEQRTNVLLIAGDHYNKINRRVATQVRGSAAVNSGQQKLRLTKNHCHKVSRVYVDAILSEAPDVAVAPQHPTELQDQKDAELNKSVYEDGKSRYRFREKYRQYAEDFVNVGEVAVKMFWNPDEGELSGYEPLIDEETGEPLLEETGQIDPMTGLPEMAPAADMTKPIFKGRMEFERIFAANLLRHPSCTDMRTNECWIIRKMVDTEDLKRKYIHDEEIISKLNKSKDDTYVVFDGAKASYDKVSDQTMLREFYWPPCNQYPQGYFVYATDHAKLEEGELPEGIFPILWGGFDEHPTTPRAHGIMKVARSFQAEINRASSAMALAQVTLGDDKILYQSGTKLAPGALLPGVRGISFQGQMPQVLPGRNGSQYLEYINSQIAEMYDVLMLNDMNLEDKSGQIEPITLLFKAASRKRKFSKYIEKFERFLVDFADLYLRLCKVYLPDDALIMAVGNREAVNIAEFRKTTPLAYQIRLDPQADTLESKFGRQVTFQHILQYVGKQLDPKVTGKIIKNMPFANHEDSFDDLTLDEDCARNDMLALERGEIPELNEYTDPEYMLKHLTMRMKKSDFKLLNPQIQEHYKMYREQYKQLQQKQLEAIQAAKNEFIPVDGALVACDFYVQDPQNPENQPKRARIPQRAVEWLMERLEQQGDTLEKMESMNQQTMAELAQQLLGPRGGGMPPQQGFAS